MLSLQSGIELVDSVLVLAVLARCFALHDVAPINAHMLDCEAVVECMVLRLSLWRLLQAENCLLGTIGLLRALITGRIPRQINRRVRLVS